MSNDPHSHDSVEVIAHMERVLERIITRLERALDEVVPKLATKTDLAHAKSEILNTFKITMEDEAMLDEVLLRASGITAKLEALERDAKPPNSDCG